MFNNSHKERYLNNCRFEEPTIPIIRIWLNASEPIEKLLDKDLYNFSRADVIKLFKSLNSKSKQTLITVAFYFSDYYQWSRKEGAVTTKDNPDPFENYSIRSLIDSIITDEIIADKYFNKDYILKCLDILKDSVLKFQLYAIYRGAYGKEYKDLSNLRMMDIDKENKTAKLNSGLEIHIDDLFIELAEEADNQIEFKPDGISPQDNWNRYVYDKSCYIFKSCRTGKVDTPIHKLVISGRFKIIKEQCKNKFLTGNIIYKNGIINYVKEKFEEDGITLKNAIFQKENNHVYTHNGKLDEYIKEFGSNMSGRALRRELEDTVNFYE